MSDYVIGRGMVTGQLSDGEIEGLLRGAPDVAGDLAEIAQVLTTLRGQGVPGPDADYTELYAAAARESRLTPLERFAMERVPAGRDLRTLVGRAAMPIAGLVMLVALAGGLVFAGNGAKPGDLLYGLDRAFEAIGIGDGGSDERLAEALALAALEAEGFEEELAAGAVGIGSGSADRGEEPAASDGAGREPWGSLDGDEAYRDPESSKDDTGSGPSTGSVGVGDAGSTSSPGSSTGHDHNEGGEGSEGVLANNDPGAGDPPGDEPPPREDAPDIDDGQLMKLFHQLVDKRGMGCLNRVIAQSDLGKGDQRIRTSDVDAAFGPDTSGLVEFTTVATDCSRDKKDKADNHQLSGESQQKRDKGDKPGRPDSPGNSGNAPGHNK
ncbi:MAG: hypothetical protein ACE1ZX_04855 [Acidimicrobiia bacterium]